jgi:hypothetical protein
MIEDKDFNKELEEVKRHIEHWPLNIKQALSLHLLICDYYGYKAVCDNTDQEECGDVLKIAETLQTHFINNKQ